VDLEPFARIDPCGYPGLAATRLADHGVRANILAVQQSLGDALSRALATP
jgi:lipoyl(octanoyl) transferase